MTATPDRLALVGIGALVILRRRAAVLPFVAFAALLKVAVLVCDDVVCIASSTGPVGSDVFNATWVAMAKALRQGPDVVLDHTTACGGGRGRCSLFPSPCTGSA